MFEEGKQKKVPLFCACFLFIETNQTHVTPNIVVKVGVIGRVRQLTGK